MCHYGVRVELLYAHLRLNSKTYVLLLFSSDNQTRSYCTTSTGASSGKGKGKSYDLPTASSVNSEAAASRREAYYASIEEARSGAASAAVTDDLFATEV